jgi:hypothetical protein
MKILAPTLCIALSASAALAQPQASAPHMPCGAAAGLVATYGAAVLGTGGMTYDRFVSGGDFCAVGEGTDPAWVPALDTPQCFVGYRCRPRFRVR